MPENVMMPYNLDAEQSVLGSILRDQRCMEEAASSLKSEHFYLPEHQEIYSSMLAMFGATGAAIDVITVADALEKSGFSGQMSAREYIIHLAESVPSTANLKQYIEIVKEQYYLREVITLCQQSLDAASGSGAEAKVLLENMEQRLYELRGGADSRTVRKLSDVIVNGVYEKLRLLNSEEREKFLGIPTGFGLLDSKLTGLNRSDLILIGARPGMGKTSFALNLAHNLTVSAKRKVMFFSLEMTNEQLAERLLSSQSGIESSKFRTGILNDDEWARLGMAVQVLYNAELYLIDNPSLTVPEMKALVRRTRDVDCVIIDYLGLIQNAESTRNRNDNRALEVQKITQALKIMAKDLEIPVVCCAQLNRATEGRGKHRPQLSDLRESGSIEQDADIVLFLLREDYYDSDDSAENVPGPPVEEGRSTLIIAKNRHGGTGDIPLIFDKEFTRFRALDITDENFN